jgi:hypothetical protein
MDTTTWVPARHGGHCFSHSSNVSFSARVGPLASFFPACSTRRAQPAHPCFHRTRDPRGQIYVVFHFRSHGPSPKHTSLRIAACLRCTGKPLLIAIGVAGQMHMYGDQLSENRLRWSGPMRTVRVHLHDIFSMRTSQQGTHSMI